MALIEQIYAEDFSTLDYATGVLPPH
uniref:Uncharacterized protein n=1 Tax=Rubrivivax gelatinosus S1 TaxID=1138313 RepID=L8BAN7_RUBGE|nr:hypothetical protein RGS1_70341 [Rubrivivax gelatinosus S1]